MINLELDKWQVQRLFQALQYVNDGGTDDTLLADTLRIAIEEFDAEEEA